MMMAINPDNSELNGLDYENDPYGIAPTKEIKADGIKSALSTKQSALPIGSIVMYDGKNWENNSTLPGWYICDGNNGTPNLIDKFIRAGTAAKDAPASSDDRQLSVTNLPAHTHSVSGTSSHTHSVNHSHEKTNIMSSTSGTTWNDISTESTATDSTGWSSSSIVSGTASSGGSGSSLGTAFDIKPKYYSMIYIMRVK